MGFLTKDEPKGNSDHAWGTDRLEASLGRSFRFHCKVYVNVFES